VDVSRRHDLNKELKGVLLVLAGLELAKLLKKVDTPAVREAREKFQRWAHGYSEWAPYDPVDEHEPDEEPGAYDDPGYFVRRPSVLSPPLVAVSSEVTERTGTLRALMDALPEPRKHFVILLESLDRLADIEKFRDVVVEDIRAMKLAGVGVVVVGPSRVVYGANR
jgi:hypothetical protein